MGGFVYWRFSSTIPVVLGAGADYQPYVDEKAETRLFGALSMELPLYTIY